jgi:protein-S-isoprenylcysteine O-methyltransferase
MSPPNLSTIGAIFGISEFALSLFLRAKSGVQDKRSLRLIWLVVLGSIFFAITVSKTVQQFALSNKSLYSVGVTLFFIGLILRWYSIIYLGRFFTVNVAIAADHKLIDSGPYRYIRHPSYTGALLAFIGFALCMSNWLSLVIILIPISAVFIYRIHVEEAALTAGLGESYTVYCKRTKRLIPKLY